VTGLFTIQQRGIVGSVKIWLDSISGRPWIRVETPSGGGADLELDASSLAALGRCVDSLACQVAEAELARQAGMKPEGT
jgi:hypothetical protein